jgi:hypothetical protein
MNPLHKHLVGLSETERKNLRKWFGKMDTRQCELITEMKISIFRTIREDLVGRYTFAQIDHAALLLALSKHRADLGALNRKGDIDPRDLQRIQAYRELEAKKSKDRKAPLAQYIQRNLINTIEHARANGLSWRQIPKLIAKQHKKKISHTYLRYIYEEVLASRKNAE